MAPTQVGLLMSITPNNRVQLKNYPLEEIDEMRDVILSTKGNITSIPNKSSVALYDSFGQRLPNGKLNTTLKNLFVSVISNLLQKLYFLEHTGP